MEKSPNQILENPLKKGGENMDRNIVKRNRAWCRQGQAIWKKAVRSKDGQLTLREALLKFKRLDLTAYQQELASEYLWHRLNRDARNLFTHEAAICASNYKGAKAVRLARTLVRTLRGSTYAKIEAFNQFRNLIDQSAWGYIVDRAYPPTLPVSWQSLQPTF